jgi:hypothetical protein
MKKKRGNFFAIDKYQWAGVCELGLNVALLYLLLARGSDKSNRFTIWSANSLEKYTGVTRRRAKEAKICLLGSEYVNVICGGKNPKYELPRSPAFQEKRDEIWLPNELITGAVDEVTAIERVRQTGDVMRLRMLVDLYHQQNLVDDCGVARECIHESYERKRIAESGIYTIWGFSCDAMSCFPQNEAVSPHHVGDSDLFLERFNTLRDLGLVEVKPYLCETDKPDAEIIHPLDSVFGCEDLSLVMEEAVLNMLPDQYSGECCMHDFVVPVPRHIGNAAVIGIVQTRYRPKTSLTAAAKAHHIEQISSYRDAYEQMGIKDDVQYQGGIKVESRLDSMGNQRT